MSSVRDIEFTTYGQTVLHPFAALLTSAMCVLVFRLSRTQVILPLLVVTAMVTHQQRVVIFDLDFSMQRIVIIAALLRMTIKGEFQTLKTTTLDKFVFVWVVCGVVMYVVRDPSFGSFINRTGFAIDSLGMYVVARSCVRTPEDLKVALRMLAFILLPISLEMVYENITGRNLFHFMGAPEYAFLRDGRLRCMGAMGHPVLAGSFGAACVPLMIGLALQDKSSRTLGWLGAVAGIVIAATSASSGPAICLIAGLAAWGIWSIRAWLRPLLWGIVALLSLIHVVREKPVWHLIGRLSDLIGGTGYHRVRLIDAAVNNFDQWWLKGSKNSAYWGWGLQDTTNWYVAHGLQGGLITLLAFLFTIIVAFRSVGYARRISRRMQKRNPRGARSLEVVAWGVGASLVAHTFAWISVSYFGTMKLFFYLELSFVASLANARIARPLVPKVASRKPEVPAPDSLPTCESPAGVNALLSWNSTSRLNRARRK
jgi:hypothetical protein